MHRYNISIKVNGIRHQKQKTGNEKKESLKLKSSHALSYIRKIILLCHIMRNLIMACKFDGTESVRGGICICLQPSADDPLSTKLSSVIASWWNQIHQGHWGKQLTSLILTRGECSQGWRALRWLSRRGCTNTHTHTRLHAHRPTERQMNAGKHVTHETLDVTHMTSRILSEKKSM